MVPGNGADEIQQTRVPAQRLRAAERTAAAAWPSCNSESHVLIKIATIAVWLTLAAGAVAAMFHITFEVENSIRLHEVNREIVREQEAIHVLRPVELSQPSSRRNAIEKLLPNLSPVAAAHSRHSPDCRNAKRRALEGPSLSCQFQSLGRVVVGEIA